MPAQELARSQTHDPENLHEIPSLVTGESQESLDASVGSSPSEHSNMTFSTSIMSTMRSDMGLASPVQVPTSGKSPTPFYPFTSSNPRKRSHQNSASLGAPAEPRMLPGAAVRTRACSLQGTCTMGSQLQMPVKAFACAWTLSRERGRRVAQQQLRFQAAVWAPVPKDPGLSDSRCCSQETVGPVTLGK
ncbi:hypothetical protein E1301_Tti003247 [Triplophysa tibetana]|uniref:Uncharacterized protein n=1 Tax=Triplophysa tibetana TaxID=1572043 RepID=A0A5A9PP69_9TELE|nr:hypothetical protein E1301_Tti003247 [Triplophysa tibetana]